MRAARYEAPKELASEGSLAEGELERSTRSRARRVKL